MRRRKVPGLIGLLPRKADYDEYREIMGDLKIHITVAPK